ncbi:hypothetical protein Tco_0413159 [Tanacetum coccineum]
MAPKRATRSTPVTTTTDPTATTTTTVTNAQLQAMINQGVSAALAARDATRNGTDSHSSGTEGSGLSLTQWCSNMRDSHVMTVLTHDVAYSMTWVDLKKNDGLTRMFPEEANKIERYVGGLPDMIHGNIEVP